MGPWAEAGTKGRADSCRVAEVTEAVGVKLFAFALSFVSFPGSGSCSEFVLGVSRSGGAELVVPRSLAEASAVCGSLCLADSIAVTSSFIEVDIYRCDGEGCECRERRWLADRGANKRREEEGSGGREERVREERERREDTGGEGHARRERKRGGERGGKRTTGPKLRTTTFACGAEERERGGRNKGKREGKRERVCVGVCLCLQ